MTTKQDFVDPVTPAAAAVVTPDLSGYALKTDLVTPPTPMAVAPPAVGSASQVGASGMYARGDHTHKSSVQCKTGVTDANGQVTVSWDAGFFSAAPNIMGMAVLDSAGAAYSVTPMTVTATGATFQVRKLTPLPASILSVGVLASYNTAPIAPAGLTLFVSAHA